MKASGQIRLLTYNIRKGKGASGRLDGCVAALSKALAEHKLDVLLCQEVFHDRAKRFSQSTLMAKSLGLSHYYVPNKTRRVGHHGNATFTHLPVEFVRNFNISTNPIERRGVLYSRLKIQDTTLHVLNAHLGLNEGQRLKQIKRIEEIINTYVGKDEPVILGGDFNDWTRRLDHIIKGMGFHNPFAALEKKEGHTWHARRPMFTLDRIYIRNLQVLQVRRFHGHPWTDLSDHLPLWVRLSLHHSPIPEALEEGR